MSEHNPSTCWQCGKKFNKDKSGDFIFVVVKVDGKEVRVHKICFDNLKSEKHRPAPIWVREKIKKEFG